MTDEDLVRIELTLSNPPLIVARERVAELVAEVRRLRGLIATARAHGLGQADICPFCGDHGHGSLHRDECPTRDIP